MVSRQSPGQAAGFGGQPGGFGWECGDMRRRPSAHPSPAAHTPPVPHLPRHGGPQPLWDVLQELGARGWGAA